MFGKKNQGNPYEEDVKLLMEHMEKAIGGDLSAVDPAAFHDGKLAECYNKMLDSVLKANNTFVMRLNDSMTRIGDSSVVKNMLEEVQQQTDTVRTIGSSGQELGNSIMNIQDFAQGIQKKATDVNKASASCIEEMENSIGLIQESSKRLEGVNDQVVLFRESAEHINDITDQIKNLADNSSLLALNASIEAARAGESGRGFAIVAQQMGQLSNETAACADGVVKYVEEFLSGIDGLSEAVAQTTEHLKDGTSSVEHAVGGLEDMSDQIEAMGENIDSIYSEISNQSALTQEFVAVGTTIAQSYERLNNECIATGEHLYHISRDIDNCRSDMARQRSNLSMQDWLHVFEVDHLIFTWRLYNNIVGFEHLKITQLNNPKGCKLGKWLGSQKDPKITGSSAFKEVSRLHEELHRHACNCWNANEEGDRENAMMHFERAYDTYGQLLKAFSSLKAHVKGLGYKDVTEYTRKV